MNTVQDAFYFIEKLAAICATPGINTDTQDIANSQIQRLLTVVELEVKKITAQSSGIII